MELLPIFLDVRDRLCVVVGGGEVATRKVALLREVGARVKVVSPRLTAELAERVSSGAVEARAGAFRQEDLDGAHLVVSATDDPAVNAEVSRLARDRRIPVNVVDQPELCTFVVPSIINRSPVVAAVSTGGAAPVLARLIRARLETLIPAAFGRLAAVAADFRGRVKAHFPHPPDRRKFWERVFQGPVAEMVFAGREEAARAALAAELEATPRDGSRMGEVYLVGGGPGDPDLLTFRALRLMQQADVVVYDRLVAPEVLDLCRRDAERIYVGKERDNHAVPQEEINRTLARLAKQGRRVLRLKGGDPFIFGRGGEEIETLAEEGVPFQVVRLRPVLRVRDRAPEGRQRRPELAGPGPAPADRGVLHGVEGRRVDLPGAAAPRDARGDAGGAGPAGHHATPAGLHRDPRNSAGDRAPRGTAPADPDHRRRGRALAGQAGLVPAVARRLPQPRCGPVCSGRSLGMK